MSRFWKGLGEGAPCPSLSLGGGIGAIYQSGRESGAESIIYVDGYYPSGARVQHAEKRGQTAEAGAIADTGWHGDDRSLHQAGDDARQGSLHSGNHDQDLG
jgi:hypothetical protein